MKNLLIDHDSYIPNLALMQLSSHLKANGEEVALAEGPFGSPWDPERVWISCVFTWNRTKAESIAAYFRRGGAEVHLGGTGVDFEVGVDGNLVQRQNTELPKEAEHYPPDYALYKDDRAIGFSVRGCNRKCEFCVVPRKEGKINVETYRPLRSWVPEERKKVMLLDNNIAQSPFHDQTIQEGREMGLKLSITQGYDIRTMTPERAAMLAETKPYSLKFDRRCLYIAWDYMGIEGSVRRGVQMLLDAGFKGGEIMCYTLCGFNTTHEENLHRFDVLRSFGVLPFVMPYNKRKDDLWLNAFARFCNRLVYKSCSWEEYWSGKQDAHLKSEGEPLEDFGDPLEAP